MTNILFVHSNFPGQFGFVAQALLARGMRCEAIASATSRQMPGIPLSRWGIKRGSTPGIFVPAVRAEADCIRGRAAAECALMLRQKGFVPDLIIGHPGWGETLFLRDIFPKAKQIIYGEYYYRAEGGDVGFDPEFGEVSVDERFRVHAINATLALALSEANRIVCASRFQASLLPPIFAARMTIIHEGIDTAAVRPNRDASLTLANGRLLDRSLPIVTFINRRFEPLRGFHIFMRALPKVLAEVPDCQAVLIGADETGGYGKPAPANTTWKKHYPAEIEGRCDKSRLHFTGRIPYRQMLAALSISLAHVYYTYPFVLSWSLLEAMASECLVVCSDTAPVRDVVQDGKNGLLLDFFDVDLLARTLITACREPERFSSLRKAARQTVVDEFDRARLCLPAWMRLVDEVLGVQTPGA